MKDQIQTTWTVGELFDFKNGQFIKVQEFFLNYNLKDEEDQDRLIELRHELELAIQKKIAAKYGCWYCKGLASLRAVRSDKRIIYFKAIHSLECKEKSKNLSREQISRIKYNGQQEGELHLILKRKIAELLELNKINKGEIQEVVIEKPRKLTTDPSSHEWKKPDIFTHFYKNKCIYNIAFELQLSTTFLDVVISRQDFYKRDGSYIIWVFNNFDHERRNQKMMQLDIVVSNNKNAFVINEITIAESYKVNDLVLICHYKSYHRKGSEIVSKWNEQLITLSDLCFDDDYKVYYYNSDAEYNNLNKQIQIENKSCELTRVKEYEQKTNGTYIGNEGQVIEILSSEDKIHEILDLLKKIYNSNSEVNDLYWWINRKIYALQEIDVQYLNKKLKFNTDNKSFIESLIYGIEHLDFLDFILENHNIEVELNKSDVGKETLFMVYMSKQSRNKICNGVELFIKNGYNLTEIDKTFISNTYKINDYNQDGFSENYFVNLLISLNSLDSIRKVNANSKLRNFILVLLPLKYNQCSSWEFDNFASLELLIYDKYKEYALLFDKAVKLYGRVTSSIHQNSVKNRKLIELTDSLNNKLNAKIQDEEILKIIFPELF